MIKKFIQLLIVVLLFTTPSVALDEEVYSSSTLAPKNKSGNVDENPEATFITTSFIGGSLGILVDWLMESRNPYFSLVLTILGVIAGSYMIENVDTDNSSKDSKA